MKKIGTFVFLLAALFCSAQSTKERLLLGAGYTYFNRSFGEIGARYVIPKDGYFLLGANVLLGSSDKKLLVIPEINATQYFDLGNDRLPFVKLDISPKTITPQVSM